MVANVNDKPAPKKVDINKAHALFEYLSTKMYQNISKILG
jgi:hypothetical protein